MRPCETCEWGVDHKCWGRSCFECQMRDESIPGNLKCKCNTIYKSGYEDSDRICPGYKEAKDE